jgi:hypothetical protein
MKSIVYVAPRRVPAAEIGIFRTKRLLLGIGLGRGGEYQFENKTDWAADTDRSAAREVQVAFPSIEGGVGCMRRVRVLPQIPVKQG